MTGDEARPFNFNEFPTAGTVSDDGWHLTVPDCQHLPNYADTFPWTRYGIAFPAHLDMLHEVVIGGLNQQGGFVLQMDDSDLPQPLNIGTEEAPYRLLVSQTRLDCRALENTEWTVR